MSRSMRSAWIEIDSIDCMVKAFNVALHAERVDRNFWQPLCFHLMDVALHAERVDRNTKITLL